MLTVKQFTFNDFQENTYIIINEKKQCWIIDPGMYRSSEEEKLFSFIEQQGLIPQAIINTHTHLDHIFGVQAVKDKYNITFGIHKDDEQVLKFAASSAAMFGIDFQQAPNAEFYIPEGAGYKLGDETIDVFHCPGHSPGSIVFYYAAGNWAVGGDVLFSGSIGRTDLPGGSFETLINSIQGKLFNLPDETKVYPGHGPYTTIGEEKISNPFCKLG